VKIKIKIFPFQKSPKFEIEKRKKKATFGFWS
jgi:hypothetical protein